VFSAIAGTLVTIILLLNLNYFGSYHQELKLSDFPEVFADNTLIVVGDEASGIEIQAANEISSYLGSKPQIKKYSELGEEEKKNYNLIVIGTPKSNRMLEEIYAVADVLEVNETFPGEGKGVLEIARNPWNEERAILLIEGGDYTGIFLAIKSAGKKHNTSYITVSMEDYYKNKPYVHVILEFTGPLEFKDEEKLRRLNVRLLDYLPEYSYFALIPVKNIEEIKSLDFVKDVRYVLIENKLSSDILRDNIGEWATNPDGTVNLRVKFFEDVSEVRALGILGKYSKIFMGPEILNYWEVIGVDKNKIYNLALEDEVQWIEPVPPPPIPASLTVGSAYTMLQVMLQVFKQSFLPLFFLDVLNSYP